MKKKNKYNYVFLGKRTITELFCDEYGNEFEEKREIVTFSRCLNTYDLHEDNWGTPEYITYSDMIFFEINHCIKNPIEYRQNFDYYFLKKIIDKLGFITTPHLLAETVQISLDILLKELKCKNILYFPLGRKIFIPTSCLIPFIKKYAINKVNTEWYEWKVA